MHLFEPLQIRDVTFRNRIFVSPMCQYSSEEGFANDWHFVHLGSRAVGGAALVITEAAAVTADGRISPDDLGIWSDDHIQPLGRIFRFITQQGAIPGVQLAHAGRKASTSAPWLGGFPLDLDHGGWAPILAPSPLAFNDGYQTPVEMSLAQIQATLQAFAQAARRALAAGAQMLELHAAHGYLLHSFLSPLSNHRRDHYGGSFENRIRLLCETVHSVRQVWPERYPLFVRISSTDWTADGWQIEDSIHLATALRDVGVDLIDCSSGGTVPKAAIPVGAGYQVPFAERIRREARIMTAAVGMITEASQADQIIRTGEADAVFLARELLRDPYWPLRVAHQLKQNVAWPNQYLRARRS